MLELKNITFKYETEKDYILKNLSFSVKKGEFISIIGHSGCGKSTIFKIICNLIQKESGTILINNKPIENNKYICGYMPQKDLLFPWRTVLENLKLPMQIQKSFTNEQIEKKAKQTLEKIGLNFAENKKPSELSGGMRQRIAFARTLLTGSEILLLDEPFSALDFLTKISMQEWLIDQCKRENKTVLFITHDVEEAIFLSNKVLVIENSPISNLLPFEIPYNYPRTREFLTKRDIVELKEHLIDKLRMELKNIDKK